MLEQSSLKKIVVILSGITLILLAGVLALLWLLSAKHGEFNQSEKNTSSKKEEEVLRTQYKMLLDRTKEKRERLATYIVRGDADTADLLETIEGFALKEGLPITENVTIEKTSSSARALAMTLEVKGDFEKVMSFLSALESLPHEILFRDITLRRSSELSSTVKAGWTLSAGFLVKSFQP